LQAQINPHILYNTLDLINWEALEYDAPEIAKMARSLAQFFRTSLSNGQQLITLTEEVAQVRAYIEVENYHFDNRIDLDVQLDPTILECASISHMLQPLVENSILHGYAKGSSDQAYRITISGIRQNGCLLLTVSDEGKQPYPDPLASVQNKGFGTKNLHQRLRFCYGDEYGLSYQRRDERIVAVIRIPAYTLKEAMDRVHLSIDSLPLNDMDLLDSR